MYTSYVIEDFLTSIKEQLPEFNYLGKDFYDPNLDFDNRLRSYLVKFDASQLEGSEKDWIGICWSRGVIQDAPEFQDRSFAVMAKNLQTLFAKTYTVKFAKVSFNIAYFSNSLDYIEDFEESHYLTFNKIFTHQVLLPVFGWTSVMFTELTLGDIQKLERNDKGTIVELSFSFSAIFPIAKLNTGSEVPLIGEAVDPITGLPNGKPKINLKLFFEVV